MNVGHLLRRANQIWVVGGLLYHPRYRNPPQSTVFLCLLFSPEVFPGQVLGGLKNPLTVEHLERPAPEWPGHPVSARALKTVCIGCFCWWIYDRTVYIWDVSATNLDHPFLRSSFDRILWKYLRSSHCILLFRSSGLPAQRQNWTFSVEGPLRLVRIAGDSHWDRSRPLRNEIFWGNRF